MQLIKITNNTVPLYQHADGRLICYCQGKVMLMREGEVERSFTVPVSAKERYLGWSWMATRLFRFGVRAAEAIDDDLIVLLYR